MIIDHDILIETGLIECDELVWPYSTRLLANLANIRGIFGKLVKEKYDRQH